MNSVQFEIAGLRGSADLTRGASLAIPLHFNGPQPNFFDAPAASIAPLHAFGFTGDTREGGSCNVGECHLVPHCNGTHTECIGHVVDDATTVTDQLRPSLLPAILVTLIPRDNMIDALLVSKCLQQQPRRDLHTAFILRTSPNGDAKLSRRYRADNPAPYLTDEAVSLLVAAGVEHLLVDMPSLDPAHDGGRLAAHRAFWGLPAGSRCQADAKHPNGTITEMIYVPDKITDGHYLLDLQIPAFMSDAAPSRPVIYPMEIE